MLHCQACSPPVRAQSSVDLQVVRGAWLAASARLQSCIAAGASATASCGPLATGAIQFDASIRCIGYVLPHTRLPERLSYVQHCFKVLPAQAAMKDLRCRGRANAQPTSQSIAYTKLLNVCPRCSVLGAALFGWHSLQVRSARPFAVAVLHPKHGDTSVITRTRSAGLWKARLAYSALQLRPPNAAANCAVACCCPQAHKLHLRVCIESVVLNACVDTSWCRLDMKSF